MGQNWTWNFVLPRERKLPTVRKILKDAPMNMTFAIITPSVGQIHSNMITLAANMTGFRLLVAISLVTGAKCYKSHMLVLRFLDKCHCVSRELFENDGMATTKNE